MATFPMYEKTRAFESKCSHKALVKRFSLSTQCGVNELFVSSHLHPQHLKDAALRS